MLEWEWDALGAGVLSCCCVGVVPAVLLAGDIFALLFPRPSLPPAKALCVPGLCCAVGTSTHPCSRRHCEPGNSWELKIPGKGSPAPLLSISLPGLDAALGSGMRMWGWFLTGLWGFVVSFLFTACVNCCVTVYFNTAGCSEPLGMKSRLISDQQITASSVFKTWGIDAFTWHPHYARLDKTGKTNAWTALNNDQSEWLQVGLWSL